MITEISGARIGAGKDFETRRIIEEKRHYEVRDKNCHYR